ncbi:MAG: phage portal protein, partial [Anaerolineales bacterium]
MILSRALKSRPVNKTLSMPEVVELFNTPNTVSGEPVTPESSKTIASAYRAGNIISDDVAKLPFQMFRRTGDQITQVPPDGFSRNVPYLLEVSPNLWNWTPFQFKKAVIQWLIYYGNAYVWRPPVWPPQLLVLPADMTLPMLDLDTGLLWYYTVFYNGMSTYLNGVEILHLMINPE